MYDWPEVREATDTIWIGLASALRRRGFDAPDRLDRGRPEGEIWRDPDLLIAQTCGYPFVTELAGRVRLVATPVYDVYGCSGPLYCSHIVVRKDEAVDTLGAMAGRTVAINNLCSQSGFAALHRAVASLQQEKPFFGAVKLSGSHLKSMLAVAEGAADVAAIDAVCWALARRYRADVAARLKSIATTAQTPGLPFVTAGRRSDRDADLMAEALFECLNCPETAAARKSLFLQSVERVPEADYFAAYSRLSDEDTALLIPEIRAGGHRADNATIAETRFR